MWCSSRVNTWTIVVLIYVNDMSGVIGDKLFLYADDSAILVADKDISTVENALQTDLQIVSEWLMVTNYHCIWVKLSLFYLALNQGSDHGQT